jgi:hypothetical protein
MASDFERALNDDAGRGRVIAQESFGESYARSLRTGARDFYLCGATSFPGVILSVPMLAIAKIICD